jgi:hypothetical protein
MDGLSLFSKREVFCCAANASTEQRFFSTPVVVSFCFLVRFCDSGNSSNLLTHLRESSSQDRVDDFRREICSSFVLKICLETYWLQYILSSGYASSYIRYGLVARISRSHTVFSVTQLGPRRPGFNSPCRNILLLVDRTTRLFCVFRRFLSTMSPRKMILFVIIIEDEICEMELSIV